VFPAQPEPMMITLCMKIYASKDCEMRSG
jgi:hypothetical protein